eukprot:TRINITY_DN6237_c0_g1_i1.p1 TRINITY_DN6237_c0_g1~~TRINITY_DN6237_c0_g1_i1.p1  ORF type:complete len:442 (-),score=132.55 TRINITY_DN6237_c0_g1_i1:70-1200(-)
MKIIPNEWQLNQFLSDLLRTVPTNKNQGLVLGFDVEYGYNKSVATIQLSTSSLACVIQIGRIMDMKIHTRNVLKPKTTSNDGEISSETTSDGNNGNDNQARETEMKEIASLFPESLSRVLQSRDIIKLGVGVHEDAEAIQASFGIQCDGLVDISILSIKNGLTKGYYSLKVLAQDLLKIKKEESTGGWSRRYLTEQQVKYATMDAWLGYQIGITLYSYLKENNRETFYVFAQKNITSAEDIETYNPSAAHRTKSHNNFAPQETKHLDRYQRERMEKRNQRAQQGYFLKRLEAKKKQKEFTTGVENNLSSLLSDMKKKKEAELEQALSSTNKSASGTTKTTAPPTTSSSHKSSDNDKDNTNNSDDEDDGLMLANFIF